MPTELNGLFSHYWVADMATLSRVDEIANASSYSSSDRDLFVKPEMQLTSLLGNDPLAQQHFNRARIFAGEHPGTDDMKLAAQKLMNLNCERAGIDFEEFAAAVVKLAKSLNGNLPTGERFDETRLEDNVRIALRQALMSRQMTQYCKRLGSPRDFNVVGRLEFKNGILGLVKLLQSGRIGEDAILHAIDTEIYDLRNTSDLIKIAERTRTAVATTFVDDRGVKTILDAAKRRIVDLFEAKALTTAQADSLMEKYAQLAEKAQALLAARTKATKILGTDVVGMNPEKALKTLREGFRAFRYDLDKARGVKMESYRRWWDDLGNIGRAKITKKNYAELEKLDDDFGSLLRDLDESTNVTVFRLRANGAPIPESDAELAAIMRDGLVPVARRAEKLTELTHETNDMIRAHFQGDDKFDRDMHQMFDEIVRNGGQKNFTLHVGADAKFSIKAIGMSAKAGGGYERTVSLSVPKGGGKISITWTNGGYGEVSGEIKSLKNLNGKLEGGGGKGHTVTYNSLDAAIRSLKDGTFLTSSSALGIIARGITKPFRLLGSGVAKFLRWSGVLAQKVAIDNLAYRQHLYDSKVLDDVNSLFAPGKNALASGKREFKFFGGGVSGGAQFGPAKVKGGYSGKREFGVSYVNVYSLVESLMKRSREEASRELHASLAALGADRPDRDLRDLGAEVENCRDESTARALADRLAKCLDRLDLAASASQPLDETTGRRYAERLRICAAAYAVLDRLYPAARPQFVERLSNPPVEIPRKIFEELLTVERKVADSAHEVHTIKLGGEVDLTDGEDPTSFSEAVVNELMYRKTKIEATLTIDSPLTKTDVRTWKNATLQTLDVKVANNLPLGSLIEFIGNQVAHHTAQEPQRVKDDLLVAFKNMGLPILLAEGVDRVGIPLVKSLGELAGEGIGKLAERFPKFGAFLETAGAKIRGFVNDSDSFSKKIVEFAENLPVEGDMKMEMGGYVMSFGFVNGKFTSFACGEDSASMASLGLRVGPFGGHVEVDAHQRVYSHVIYSTISLDAAMACCDNSASPGGFHDFATRNAKAMLKLFKQIADGNPLISEREHMMREALNRVSYDERNSILANYEKAFSDLREVARDSTACGLRQLEALEAYLRVMTDAFASAA